MSEATTAGVGPAYQQTQEWKELVKRQESLVKEKRIALLELTPVHKMVFGGLVILGEIKDNYGNIVANTANREDRIGIGPWGAAFRFDKKDDLKRIYQMLYCPIYQSKLVPHGQPFKKSQHKFFYLDQEAASEKYAADMEEDMLYKGMIYGNYGEDTINFLCVVVGLDSSKNMAVKKADLCQLWDSGRKDGDNSPADMLRKKLKSMIDSPDLAYYEAAYLALSQGDVNLNKGFYKTRSGVYKFNEEIIGNHIDQVVSYLKEHDDVYIAFKKEKTPAKKVEKPRT
jgi:hypothetical protein